MGDFMRKANILTKKKLLGFLVLFELVIFILAVRIFLFKFVKQIFGRQKLMSNRRVTD